MLVDPPIDKLVEKVGCRYALTCLVIKRARHLMEKDAQRLDETESKPVSEAAKEVYQGKIVIAKD